MKNQLQIIIKESGLEATKAQFILENFQNYFEIASEWEKKAKSLVVINENQTAEMAMARTGRLFLREKRIAIEKARKELKEQALREGKAIDGIANVLKALIMPIEEYLEQQEKFVEIRAEKKAEELRLQEEKRLEDERIAKEKAEAEEREKMMIENEKLKAEARKKELELEAERKKQAKILADERARADAEKMKLEEKSRKQREAERIKTETERKEKERLAEIIKNQIECPFCYKTFNLKTGGKLICRP